MEWPTLSYEKYSDMLSAANILGILKSRRKLGSQEDSLESITILDSRVEIERKLGSGGSKEMFSVRIGGNHYALGICGFLDSPGVIAGKWSAVLREPEATDRVRNASLMVNDLCRIVPIGLNGFPFPAIIMKRYEDHGFPIYDSKNITEGMAKAEFEDVESCLHLFPGIVADIRKLIKNNIWLGRDSFNLCQREGQLRLYFNDLGTAEFYRMCSDEIPSLREKYVQSSISAFIEGFRSETIRGNPFLDRIRYLHPDREALERSLVSAVSAHFGE